MKTTYSAISESPAPVKSAAFLVVCGVLAVAGLLFVLVCTALYVLAVAVASVGAVGSRLGSRFGLGRKTSKPWPMMRTPEELKDTKSIVSCDHPPFTPW